jgi:hypothetical protein
MARRWKGIMDRYRKRLESAIPLSGIAPKSIHCKNKKDYTEATFMALEWYK